jgi:ATP-binding cassette subfamily F protein 3
MAIEIAELSRGEITHYQMSYERYLVEKEAARERLERTIGDQRERIEHIQHFVDRFRYKSSKATQVQSRIRQLEKMEIYEIDTLPRSVNIRFPEAQRSGWDVITADDISKSYGLNGSIRVFSGLGLKINRGQRVAMVGVNGAGKSTLLRLLSGIESPDSGTVRLGHNVKLAYFSQESAGNLNYSHTIWEEASLTGSRITEAEKRSLLGAFLFSGDDIKKPVSVLSGGEKSRLALFKLLLSDTNFLILDEPTNHLDMNTREIFQRALLQYGGTLLIVSHDRYFLDDLSDRVIEIRDGELYDYPGNYSRFIEKREEAMRRDERDAPEICRRSQPDTSDPRQKQHETKAPEDQAMSREKRRQEADERNRIYRERKVFMDKIGPLEAAIAKSETRRDEIDALLASPEVLSDSVLVRDLYKERKTILDGLSSDYDVWERLSEDMERVN